MEKKVKENETQNASCQLAILAAFQKYSYFEMFCSTLFVVSLSYFRWVMLFYGIKKFFNWIILVAINK